MVGLPTALLFADAGIEVVGVDVDESRLAAYRAARSDHALEPEVAALLARIVAEGKITFATRPAAANAHIVAAGTPLRDGVPDLSGVRAAADLRRAGVAILGETKEWLDALGYRRPRRPRPR